MTELKNSTPDPLRWLADELAALDRDGLRRQPRTVCPLPNGRCEFNGRVLINFATNDYLGLAGHPRLVEAAQQALAKSGTGARASALVTGRTEWHERLEDRIAEFEGTESALLFPTGYAANIGVITALVGRDDLICGDRLNHASLIDGCRLSGATVHVYPHRDADRLDHELRKHANARRRLIVTDGLFSMDGDIAPLAELCDIAEQHDAMLLVDEAHGTGVLGERGRGAAEHLGVDHRVPIRIGTLSKALGSQGGFVTGKRALIHWLFNRARSQVYSTALSPAACAAALVALDVIDSEPQRRERLTSNVQFLRTRLAEHSFQVPSDSIGPIVPIIIGDPSAAMALAARLDEKGFFVPAIRPPSVPHDTSRLRISLTSEHTQTDLAELAKSLADICRGVQIRTPATTQPHGR